MNKLKSLFCGMFYKSMKVVTIFGRKTLPEKICLVSCLKMSQISSFNRIF